MAALRRKRLCPYPPLQVANGFRADTHPGPQVTSDAAAAAVKAAWLPMIPSQSVPIQGEQVNDEPYFDE
jgi:hypothetical protein